jgi:hypothetical protein
MDDAAIQQVIAAATNAMQWRIAVLSVSSGLVGALIGGLLSTLGAWLLQRREFSRQTQDHLATTYARWFREFHQAVHAAYRLSNVFGDDEISEEKLDAALTDYNTTTMAVSGTKYELLMLEPEARIRAAVQETANKVTAYLPATGDRKTLPKPDVMLKAFEHSEKAEQAMRDLLETVGKRTRT